MYDGHTGHGDVSAADPPAADMLTKPEKRPLKNRKYARAPAQSHDVTRIYLSEIGRARLLTADEE